MSAEGRGWRRYRVARRVVECESVTSLHLAAEDGAALPAILPGQFLTFRIPDGEARRAPRNYSLSGDPADPDHLRISVRREPGGLGSTYMHALPEGAAIEATGPKGQFSLDLSSRRPVILLAAGIGVTPLLAMAHALAADRARPAWLFHACRSRRLQPFRLELAELQRRAPNLKVVSCLTQPEAGDASEGDDVVRGRITAETLRARLPIGDYEAYLCGPHGFMQAMFDLLLELGVREERIRHEHFGQGSPLVRGGALAGAAAGAERERPQAAVEVAASEGRPIVTFAVTGASALWDGGHRTLLDFAEAQGLQPAFSCRNGICNTCLCAIEGSVRYVEEPLEMPEPGHALLCCSVPDGPVSLRL